MNLLRVEDGEEKITLYGLNGKFTHIAVDALENTFVMLPEQVVQVRDWFDERVRQLIFEGHLSEHLGD
jgi:hypothetical protein